MREAQASARGDEKEERQAHLRRCGLGEASQTQESENWQRGGKWMGELGRHCLSSHVGTCGVNILPLARWLGGGGGLGMVAAFARR